MARDWVLGVRLDDPANAWPYPKIASDPRPQDLAGPAVLVTYHLGAYQALGGYLGQLPGEVLVLRHRPPRSNPRGLTRVSIDGLDELQRAQLIRRCHHTLRAGAFVFMAVDGSGPHIETEAFGRTISMDVGAFALARLARAPVRPISARWRGGKIQVVVGEPIAPRDPATMAAEFAMWLEDYVRAHPRELKWPIIDLRSLRSKPTILEHGA